MFCFTLTQICNDQSAPNVTCLIKILAEDVYMTIFSSIHSSRKFSTYKWLWHIPSMFTTLKAYCPRLAVFLKPPGARALSMLLAALIICIFLFLRWVMFGVSFIQNWRTFLKVLMKHPFALHLKHTPPEDRSPVLSLAPHNLDSKYEGNPQPFLKYPRTLCISSCHVFSFSWLFNTFLHDFSRDVNTGNIVAPKHVWTQKTAEHFIRFKI